MQRAAAKDLNLGGIVSNLLRRDFLLTIGAQRNGGLANDLVLQLFQLTWKNFQPANAFQTPN